MTSGMKRAASLSASLLARKGQAAPALGHRSPSHTLDGEKHPALPHGAPELPEKPTTAVENPVQQALAEASGRLGHAVATSPPATDADDAEPSAESGLEGGIDEIIQRAIERGIASASSKFTDEARGKGKRTDGDADETTAATRTKAPVGSHERIAMTVRLDHDRHLRLRVFAAHANRSSQEILTAALDSYLDAQGADRVKRRRLAKAKDGGQAAGGA